MSLLTDALRLREKRAGKKYPKVDDLPPFRKAHPYRVVVSLVFCGLLVAGLLYWKGLWLWGQIESLAGISGRPLPVVAESAGETGPVAVMETSPKPPVEKPVASSGSADSPIQQAGEAFSPPPVPPVPESSLPEELKPMDVNLSLAMIEDEKARQLLDEENQRKIDGFLRRMEVQGVCHQGAGSTVLLDGVLVQVGDPVGDLGLILKAIETRRLVFADRHGREYFRTY